MVRQARVARRHTGRVIRSRFRPLGLAEDLVGDEGDVTVDCRGREKADGLPIARLCEQAPVRTRYASIS